MDEGVKLVRGRLSAASAAVPAFDYLMAHAAAAGFRLVPRLTGEVPSIELQYSDRRTNPFSAQVRPDHLNFYLRGPVLKEHQSLFDAAAARYGPVPPNRLGEYRTRLQTTANVEDMLDFLRTEGAWPKHRHARRFVSESFEPVTGEHLLRAARRLADGFIAHAFGPSTDYDVLFDGFRLPPKAVFGLAATEALGFEVRPENFRGGEGTQCFRVLREHGYLVVPKGEPDGPNAGLLDEDRVWTEGNPRLVMHLRRERGAGLAAAKRHQFKKLHGRLFCERCGIDPVETFGSEMGEACIEVHHQGTQVADMDGAHVTRLDDMECLCANCHRVTHRELAAALRSPSTP
jgi:hypothetical protein